MYYAFKLITTLFLLISLTVTGCQTEAPPADVIPPADVSELTVIASNGTALLSWINPLDEDLAGIQISMNPAEGTLKNAISLGKGVSSFDVSGLENGKEYSFKIKTFDESLNYSEGVTAKTTVTDTSDVIPPADVTNLNALNKDSSVLLTWIDSTDEDVYGYEVTWNKNSAINRSMSPMELNSMMVAPNACGCYISNLVNGTEYTFTVKSVDINGNKSVGVSKTITPQFIEKSTMKVELTPSTLEKTNQDVEVTVNFVTDKVGTVKQLYYIEGVNAKIDDVIENGTDIFESKKFTVSANGTYTVATIDTAGRRELNFITITNIDKTAPAQVSNLVYSYSRNTNKILLTWINPTDADFFGTIITYGKKDSTEVKSLTYAKTITSIEIPNIPGDNSEYTINIATKDNVNNISDPKTINMVAEQGAKVTNISLSRYHLDSIVENRDIQVTIAGSNFDLLESLKVQITDGSTSQTSIDAEIKVNLNTATATVLAPIPVNPTAEGTEYTVKVIIDNSSYAEVTSSFKVTTPADVTSITLSKTQIKYGTETDVTAKIVGTNFDIRGITKVKLLDSSNNEVLTSTVEVPLDKNIDETSFIATIPLPSESGIYTVAVYFDDVKDVHCETIQIYDNPVITSVKIPTVGQTYLGDVVKVTIKGKNFTSPEATASNFEYVAINGISITDFKIISDTKATAKMTTPFTATNTDVTISYGDSYATSTLKFIEPEKYYKVGDIVLFDGSKVSVDDIDDYQIDQANKPIAVIGTVLYGGGSGLGIGLEIGEELKWAPEGTVGFDTYFEYIAVTVTGEEGNYGFEGDLDGSDNWEYICSVDPEGSKVPAINYPVFNFALNYAKTAGIENTDYAEGWYVPSIYEQYEMYALKDGFEKSLIKVTDQYGFEKTCRSSSQSSYYGSHACVLNFYSGSVLSDRLLSYKSYDNYVFVLQAFSVK